MEKWYCKWFVHSPFHSSVIQPNFTFLYFSLLQVQSLFKQAPVSLSFRSFKDDTHGSQPLDLSIGKISFQSRNLLPTSDSRAPLISALPSHMSIKGLRALGLVPSHSLCA